MTTPSPTTSRAAGPASGDALREALARLQIASDNASAGTAYPCGPPWFRANDGVLIGSPDPHVGRLIADTDTSGYTDDHDGSDDEPNAEFFAEAWNFARLILSRPDLLAALTGSDTDRATFEASLAEMKRERDEARRLHRWNVERVDGGVLICRGDHDKAEDCNWDEFVPIAERDAAKATAEAAQAEIGRLTKLLLPIQDYAKVALRPEIDIGEGEIGEVIHGGLRHSLRTQDLRAIRDAALAREEVAAP